VDSCYTWSSFSLVFSKSVINRFSDINRILRYYLGALSPDLGVHNVHQGAEYGLK